MTNNCARKSAFAGATLGAALFLATAARADLVISTAPTQNVTCSAGVVTATAKKAVLNVNDLTAMLAAGDAIVKSGSIAQDLDIKAAISWTSASRLTLDSYHSISFEKPLTVAGSSGALTITTNDGGSGGDFAFFGKGHVEYRDVTRDPTRLTIDGNQYALAKSSKGISGKFRHGGYDHYVALAKSYNAAKDGVHSSPIIGELQGIFEGLGNTISNLSINDTSHRTIGFVGDTSQYSAVIRDINLVNASVTVSQTNWSQESVGLLVGDMEGEFGPYNIFRCSATGQLSIGNDIYAGGLVGRLEGRMSQTRADVTIVAGNGSSAGGLIGYNLLGYVDQSYAAGSVAAGDHASVGGLVGNQAANPITNSYAIGSVAGGENTNVGGLAGSNNHAISTSYSVGSVNGGSGYVGGLIGNDGSQSGNLSSDYWDMDTSGISDPSQGAGNISNDPGITGLTDAQLKSTLPNGFGSPVWGQNPNVNNGYPYLLSNPPPSGTKAAMHHASNGKHD